MKLQIIKYNDIDTGKDWYKITKDGAFVSCYNDEQDAVEQFDKMVIRLQEPKKEDQIIKSIEI